MLGNTALVPAPHVRESADGGPMLGVRQYVTTAIKMQPITTQPSVTGHGVTEPARCPQQPIIAPVSSSSPGGSHDNFIGVTLHPARGQTAPNQADTGITRSSPHQQSASRHRGVISLGPGDTAEADILLPFY